MAEIPFFRDQESRFKEKGPVIDDNTNIFGEKSSSRLQHFLDRVGQVIKGERPVVGGKNLGDKWFADQLKIMIREGYLPEHLRVYIEQQKVEYTQGLNPVPQAYIEDREYLKKDMKDASIANVRTAGDRHGLFKEFRGNDMEAQIDSANMTVAIPGDFYAMKEMIHIIDQKRKGLMLDHPLIIENPVDANNRGYWDQLLRGIKFIEFKEKKGSPQYFDREYVSFEALAKIGIHISEDRETTLALAKSWAPPAEKRPLTKLSSKPFIPDGSILFVATGTKKKYEEIASICKAQGIQVEVRPIYELVGVYVGPDEDKHTYQGNVAAKVKAAFDAWHSMDEDHRMKALENNGIKKGQAFIIAEDSGYHFMEPNLAKEDEFHKIRNMLDLDAPFPGVETGPGTTGSDGIMGFMKKIEKIFGRRKNPNDEVIKKSLIAIAPLQQENYGETKMHIVSSETKGKVTFEPMPPPGKDGAIEIDNYMVPEVKLPGQKRPLTEAQMGEKFYQEYSPRALAMKGLAQEMGIAIDREKPLEYKFSKDFVAGIVVDDHNYATKVKAEEFQKQVFGEGFGVITTPSRFERPIDIQTEVLSKSDGIVFAFDPENAKADFWRNLYLFTSVIVAEQTHDKFKLSKPFYLVNPKGAFDYLVDLVTDFHHSGTVSENPKSLYKAVETIDDALAGLQEDRKKYRRFTLPPHATQAEAFDPIGRDGTKDFNVAIFCSATNKNSRNMSEAEQLADKLVDEGFGLVSGGGMLASMGKVTEVGYNKRKTHGAEHLASNTVHIMPGEGDASKYVTQFQKTRNIYERMEYMIDKSDSFVILPGGTGTVQEFALLALLKKRHLEMDDEYARAKMEHKEIFVVNPPMETQKDRGFYQKLKEIIDTNDPKACAQLGIHFVASEEEAMAGVRKLREEKRGRTGWSPPPGYVESRHQHGSGSMARH